MTTYNTLVRLELLGTMYIPSQVPTEVSASHPYVSFYGENIELQLMILFSSVIPAFIERAADQNLVINSSTARFSSNSQLTATFTCIIDSQPLAKITWYSENLAGDSTFDDPRIFVNTDTPSRERQISTLTFMSVELGDQGRFTCNATSQYGSISSTANLNIFGEHEICHISKYIFIYYPSPFV